jgi:hypothetical protein
MFPLGEDELDGLGLSFFGKYPSLLANLELRDKYQDVFI